MLFNIINPSDAYTIECADISIAAVVGVLLGGIYPLKQIGGDAKVPMLALGGEEWYKENFGESQLKDVFKSRKGEVADAFDSILIGSASDRELFNEICANMNSDEREARWLIWHEKNRSSMNDIGTWAKRQAKKYREEL